MSTFPSSTPARLLSLVLLFNLLAATLATWLALSFPWLGLTLKASASNEVIVLASEGPAALVPAGAHLTGLAVTPSGASVRLEGADLLEEPDVVADYGRMDEFFQRQGQIAAVLGAPAVRLEWESPQGRPDTTVVFPIERPITHLPIVFWFQLGVAIAGCLIACWVWVLRPGDWGARMFGTTGLLFPLFVMPAAVYSSREIALPGDLFFTLSALNHFAAFMFGAALIGIFLSYPQQMVRPRHLLWPPILFGLWWLADVLRIAPDLDWGNRFPIMAEMLLAMSMAALQWWKSRGAPQDRAALRWFILSLLVGSGLFILSMVTSVSLGWLPPLPQGYAFGFFLLMYIGIAMGLRRYRLFDLDEWAYRIFLWLGGAVLVIGLDAILIAVLHVEPGPSLGITLLACGWLYFPIRQWLWQRVARRPQLQLHDFMADVVEIAFKPSRSEQELSWDRLLGKLYDPLELVIEANTADRSWLGEDGLSLHVSACRGLEGRTLRFPDRGSRLFSPNDGVFIDALRDLVNQAEVSRDAYARGVSEERKRIARDMHDDVGARLLMLIHRAESPTQADLARAAMTDLRTALSAMESRPVALVDALADWRVETAERCEAAGVDLEWSEPQAPMEKQICSRHKSVLERAMREGITNALRHARPSRIAVAISLEADHLGIELIDNGAAPPPDEWAEGRGLRGMRHRLVEHGGGLDIEAMVGGGTRLSFGLVMVMPA